MPKIFKEQDARAKALEADVKALLIKHGVSLVGSFIWPEHRGNDYQSADMIIGYISRKQMIVAVQDMTRKIIDEFPF